MALVYIGMGSNLDDPGRQLHLARAALGELPDCKILADSGLFRSPAMRMPDDPEPQPDYINAVVKMRCYQDPHQLMCNLAAIEDRQGRVRHKTWGARTLDLDLLLYDDMQMKDKQLTLPHPGIPQRDFVLAPLARIDADLRIPGMGRVSDLLQLLAVNQADFIGEFHA